MPDNDQSIRQASLRVLILIVITIGVLILLYLLRSVFAPFILAIILAYLLEPVVRGLEHLRVRRVPAIFIVLVLILIGLVTVALVLFPVVEAQIKQMAAEFPAYRQSSQEWIEPLLRRVFPEKSPTVDDLVDTALRQLGEVFSSLYSRLGETIRGMLKGVVSLGVVIFNAVLVPVALFYLLKDKEKIRSWFDQVVPLPHKPTVDRILAAMDSVVGGFIRGQFIVALILGGMYSAGLYVVGTPLSLVIGLMAGIASLVPYLGVVIGIIPALVLTFLAFRDWQHTVAVVLIFAIAQTIETFFITPKIQGGRVGLHPLIILAAVFFGGTYFGFFGILLAIPVAGILNVLLKELIIQYRQTGLYGGPQLR